MYAEQATILAVGSILHRTSPTIAQGPNVLLLCRRERGAAKRNSGDSFVEAMPMHARYQEQKHLRVRQLRFTNLHILSTL